MIQINLDSKYSITADKFQWILMKEDRPLWFFTNLESLLNDYLNLKIKEKNIKTINGLSQAYKTQQEHLHKVLTTFNSKHKLPFLASGKNKMGEEK